MVNGLLIYTICRKLFCTICHICIKNLHYHRRQAWTRLNNHLRGPYPYNGYPIFTHQPIGIWTSVNNYISCATYPILECIQRTKHCWCINVCVTTKVPLEIALTTLGRPDDLGAHHMTTLGPGVLKSSVPTLEFETLILTLYYIFCLQVSWDRYTNPGLWLSSARGSIFNQSDRRSASVWWPITAKEHGPLSNTAMAEPTLTWKQYEMGRSALMGNKRHLVGDDITHHLHQAFTR